MSRARSLAEFAVPAAVCGALGGLVVGILTAAVGYPLTWAAAGAVALGLPLALLGGGYGALVGSGRVRTGVFAPAALYWLLGFPLARFLHATTTPVLAGGEPAPPVDIVAFLAFQGLVSVGFAVGFVWLHERLLPHWLRRISDHNPDARRVFDAAAAQAEAMATARDRDRARDRARRGAARPRSQS